MVTVNFNDELRRRFLLREAITVVTDHDDDTFEKPDRRNYIGDRLSSAGAGYLHETLLFEGKKRTELQIGVAWGYIQSSVADILEAKTGIEKRRTGSDPSLPTPWPITAKITWYPLVGNVGIAIEPTQAGEIAYRLCASYGGEVRPLGIGGIERPPCTGPSVVEKNYFEELAKKGDIVLTSASPWSMDHLLFRVGGCDPSNLPPVGPDVAGVIGGVFIDPSGREIARIPSHYRIASLGYEGYRSVASNGRVILVAGGTLRRPVILAALNGGLVSVLVTTRETGKWLLDQKRSDLPHAA